MSKSWKSEFSRYAKKNSLEWHDTDSGIGIGFSDGCDVLWVLPSEAHSTIPCPAEGPGSTKDIIATHEEINLVRGEVIHVIRHCLAENDMPVNRLPNGHWVYQEGRIWLELMVGPSLTRRVLKFKTTKKVLASLWEYFTPCDLPTAKQIKGYLKLPLPPESEAPIVGEHKPVSNEVTLAKSVKELIRRGVLIDCKTPAKLKSLKSKKALGKASLTLHLLAKLMKDCKAFVEDNRQGASLLCLVFSDGFDSYVINPDPKFLPKGIEDKTPEKAAEWIKDTYQKMDEKRTQVLNAIWSEAESRKWYLDVTDLNHGSCEHAYLGGKHQEVKIYPGPRLSDAVACGSIADALSQIMPDSPEFTKQCVTRLRDVSEPKSPLPPIKHLPPPKSAAPRKNKLLVKITDKRVKAYDTYCKGILSKVEDGPAILRYVMRNAYNLKTDTWRSPQEWQAMAEYAVGNKNPFSRGQDEVALRILWDVAPEQADVLIKEYLDGINENIDDFDGDEFNCALIPVLWHYRHNYPKIAEKWLNDGNDELDSAVLYAEERAELNDPVALRYQAGYIRDSLYTEDNSFPAPEDARYLSSSQLDHFHEKLLNWAAEEHRCSPMEHAPLGLAIHMGWHDVGQALEKNPWLITGLLDKGRRPYGHDEPGILHAHKLILAWSRLVPGPYLAQLLLTAKETDLVELAMESAEIAVAERQDSEEQTGRRKARSPQQLVSMADSTSDILSLANRLTANTLQGISDAETRQDRCRRHYTKLLSDMEFTFAIAWSRCRPHL